MYYNNSIIFRKNKQDIKSSFTIIDKILLFYFFISITSYRLNYFVAVSALILIFLKSIIKRNSLIISPIFIWSLIFWSYYLISSLWAIDKNDTFDYIPTIIYNLVIFLFIPTLIRSSKDLKDILKIIQYSLVYTALLMLLKTPISDLGSLRLGSSLNINENSFGFLMSFGAILSLYFIKKKI